MLIKLLKPIADFYTKRVYGKDCEDLKTHVKTVYVPNRSSGLAFYGEGFGSSVNVGEYQDTTLNIVTKKVEEKYDKDWTGCACD